MKQVVSLLLALLLACGMGAAAFAEDVTVQTSVPQFHTVTVEATGGSVLVNQQVCGATVQVERQKEQTWHFSPEEGRILRTLFYNGQDVTGQVKGNVFTAPPLIGDAVLKAVFSPSGVKPPNTGDGRCPWLWLALMLAACGGLLTACQWAKKRQNKP